MVMLATRATPRTYLIVDDQGYPVGTVDRPTEAVLSGRTAGTIFLARTPPVSLRPAAYPDPAAGQPRAGAASRSRVATPSL